MSDEQARAGEALARDWYEERGWTTRDVNWTRDLGELDLVVERSERWGDTTVSRIAFVEVKTRARGTGPLPEVRVDHHKRRKLVTLAKLYLAEHRIRRCVARWDVVGVDLDTETIRQYPAAFDASGGLR